MTSMDDILHEIRNNREASKQEHSTLLSKMTALEEDLRGNPDRDIEGIIPKVKRHDKVLKPIEYLGQHKKVALIVLIVAFHLLAYGSFKGLDKLISLLP